MKPLISIIIPVYNDPKGLRETLTSLINQNNPPSYEVIVVDNNSKDYTLKIANDFKNKHPELIKILMENNIQSSYAARNRGVLSSKGELIAFIDSDITVDPDWSSRINSAMSDERIKYLGCNVEITLDNNKSIPGLYNKISGFKIAERIREKHYIPTACLVIRKEVIDKIGLFDSRLISGGDLEFGNRVWKAGYVQYYDETIVVKHPARLTLYSLIKKHFRIGRGEFQNKSLFRNSYKLYSSVFFKHIFLNPKGFLSSMRVYVKKYKIPFHYIFIFYFIKYSQRLSALIGYYYEKRLQRKSN